MKVAVIGAGTAGLSALREVFKKTKDAVLINGGSYGTTCARVGCMPSKVLIQAADDFDRRRLFAQKGIRGTKDLRLNTRKLMDHVRCRRDYFTSGVLKTIRKIGQRNLKGYARFIHPRLLDVDGQRVKADAMIIATGSSPVIPSRWKSLEKHLITTDNFFELKSLSDHMSLIGAGAIGLEIGQALSGLGIKVDLIEASGSIGGLSDPEVNRMACKYFESKMNLHLNTQADLSLEQEKVVIRLNSKTLKRDNVFLTMGRMPNIDKLELENLHVRLNEKGLPHVNPHTLQVGSLPVFMAGDVNGDRPVLHEAADEGVIAGYNALRRKPYCFKRRVPLAIAFTDPQIVVVGKGYHQVKKEPHKIGEARFDSQGRSLILDRNTGLLRLYVRPSDGRLLGAEMLAPHAEYIGHLLAWSLQNCLSVFDILKLPFYHPTVLEGLRSALREVAGKVKNRKPSLELAPCEELPVSCFN